MSQAVDSAFILDLILPLFLTCLCSEFRLSDDMYAQDSIELLKQSGIDFAQVGSVFAMICISWVSDAATQAVSRASTLRKVRNCTVVPAQSV